jgi:hypothetical protein
MSAANKNNEENKTIFKRNLLLIYSNNSGSIYLIHCLSFIMDSFITLSVKLIASIFFDPSENIQNIETSSFSDRYLASGIVASKCP